MRRLALVGASVVVLSSGVFAEAAVAQGNGPSPCKLGSPGQIISAVEPDRLNPGNPLPGAGIPVPPPVAAACNPSPEPV